MISKCHLTNVGKTHDAICKGFCVIEFLYFRIKHLYRGRGVRAFTAGYGKDKRKRKSASKGQHCHQSSPGKSSGCFNDKAVYFHRLSVPDLLLVPQSHGLDLGKHCTDLCLCECVCACARLSTNIILG